MSDFEIEGAEQTQGLAVQEETQAEPVGTLQQLLTVPEVINVNGVDVSTALIDAKINEIKELAIPAVTDLKLIKQLEGEKSKLVKLRTGSEKWRKEVDAPVKKWQSDLKKAIDGFAAQCKSGEELIIAKLKPAADEKERLANLAIIEKEKETKERYQFLIDNGAVVDRMNGTYSFPFDTNLFFNEVQIPDFTVEEWQAEKELVSASYALETARLDQVEKDRVANEQAILDQANANKAALDTLNAKRTALRKKELKMEGFTEGQNGVWSKGSLVISPLSIETTEDEAWDEGLLNAVNTQQAPTSSGWGGGNYEPATGPAASAVPASNIASDFAVEDQDEEEESFDPEEEEFNPEEEPDTSGEPETTEAAMSRTLFFAKTKPFVEFSVSGNFKQRIFPKEYEGLALMNLGGELAANGPVNEQLMFALIKIS